MGSSRLFKAGSLRVRELNCEEIEDEEYHAVHLTYQQVRTILINSELQMRLPTEAEWEYSATAGKQCLSVYTNDKDKDDEPPDQNQLVWSYKDPNSLQSTAFGSAEVNSMPELCSDSCRETYSRSRR